MWNYWLLEKHLVDESMIAYDLTVSRKLVLKSLSVKLQISKKVLKQLPGVCQCLEWKLCIPMVPVMAPVMYVYSENYGREIECCSSRSDSFCHGRSHIIHQTNQALGFPLLKKIAPGEWSSCYYLVYDESPYYNYYSLIVLAKQPG